ncbi:MAG: spermidine/putrescine ABC transporter substrate-binding protein [Anaerolineales bacterium]
MQKRFSLVFGLFLIAVLALSACGPRPSTPTSAPSTAAPATQAPQKYVTSSGFECPEPEPRMEVTSKELNLFVWTEYIPTEWKECFEMVYGVKINHDEYSSNEEMYAKLEKGGANYDLVQPTDYIVSLMIQKGMLQKLDKSKLYFLDNMLPQFMNQPFDPNNEYTVPYQAGTDAIVYNSKTVQTPPTKWADLWNPEYAGRMVFLDDSRVIIGMTLLTLGYDVNTRDPNQLNEAKEKLKELIPNVKLFDSDSPKTALIAGDVDLGVTWTGEAFLAQQEVPEIQYVYPEEGAILWQDNWAMPVGAPHPDAAYAWMNYTMQGNMFWLMLRDFPYINPNKAALEFAKANHPDIYEPYINSPITNPPLEVFQKGHRISDVGEALPLYDQIWTEVKSGQ